MSNTIPVQEWLGFIDAEYLSTFIRDGGASVKFAVTQDERKLDLYSALEARCQELDYAPGHFFWAGQTDRLATLGAADGPTAG